MPSAKIVVERGPDTVQIYDKTFRPSDIKEMEILISDPDNTDFPAVVFKMKDSTSFKLNFGNIDKARSVVKILQDKMG